MGSRLASRSLIALSLTLLAGARAFGGDDPAPAPIPAPGSPDPDEARGYVGWGPGLIQDLDEKEREKLGIKRAAGLYVASVLPKGPGDKADLRAGDVVLKVHGKDVTSAEKIPAKDDGAYEKWQKDAFASITSSIKPGEEVEMVLERAGKPLTIKPTAITETEKNELVSQARDDMAAVAVPGADDQGAPRAVTFGFEKLSAEVVRPEEILSIHGMWEVKSDDDADPEIVKKDNHVLNQSSDLGENYSLVLATAKGLSYLDASSSTRLRLVAGEKSVSGGIVLRARDRKNWYAVVANGSATKLQVVLMKDLVPTVVASADLGQPTLKKWHTLEVSITGDMIKGVFDGKATVEAKDATLKQTGWFGLLTKGDAETDFDDWKITPVAK